MHAKIMHAKAYATAVFFTGVISADAVQGLSAYGTYSLGSEPILLLERRLNQRVATPLRHRVATERRAGSFVAIAQEREQETKDALALGPPTGP